VGTAFEVYLPANVPAGLSVGLDVSSSEDVPVGPRILVVEDELPIAAMLQRQLKGFGYHATVHIASLDALDAFQKRPNAFDLVITDNTMPRLTGIELARRIRALRADIPVLLVSGIAETITPEQLAENGITAALPKPHTLAELKSAITRLLAPRT
jgi:two-component system, cell cycle sensor histidine kinase and response regulator CckA